MASKFIGSKLAMIQLLLRVLTVMPQLNSATLLSMYRWLDGAPFLSPSFVSVVAIPNVMLDLLAILVLFFNYPIVVSIKIDVA
jgi:hypothetical protein